MRLCVVNGSPRGAYSTTLQTVLYLEKRFPAHSFTFLNAGTGIHGLEADFTPATRAVAQADVLLFTYPVYTFLAPSQLHTFIRLLKESGVPLAGKYASQITTSKHFYDVTAHRYIEDNCRDMGLSVVKGLSADMEDLLTEKGRREAEDFFRFLVFSVENALEEAAPAPRPAPKEALFPVGEPDDPAQGQTAVPRPALAQPSPAPSPKEGAFDIAVVADLSCPPPRRAALLRMIAAFSAACPSPTRLVDIGAYPFKGGCLGCFGCAGDGKCVYKDGFDTFLRDNIQQADAVVYAFAIQDHSMGPRFKMYDDRQFCNGHRTVTEGMPFAYLALGDYEGEENLRCLIEARCQVGHNYLAGVGYNPRTIARAAARLAYALQTGYLPPRNFYGVGGMKIFRDLIWLMRGLMKADHDFYKAHGLYDFPQNNRGQMWKMLLLGGLVRNPGIKAKMGNKMNEGMVAPYKKVLDATGPAEE